VAGSKPQPLPSEWRRRSLLKVRRPSWSPDRDPQRAAAADERPAQALSAPRAS